MERKKALAFILFFPGIIACSAMATIGVEVIGVGPVSRSVRGVSVAHAGDALATFYNNPTAITQLKEGQFDPGGSMLWVYVLAETPLRWWFFQVGAKLSLGLFPSRFGATIFRKYVLGSGVPGAT